MKNEFQIGEQTIQFVLLPAGDVWRGALLLGDKDYEVEIETVNSGNTIGQVNWDKVEQVLKFIVAEFSSLLEKASKNLHYFVKECGLYNPYELEAMREIALGFIEILHPVSTQSTFRLNFYSDVDIYGQWRVSFIRKHLVGVERIQI